MTAWRSITKDGVHLGGRGLAGLFTPTDREASARRRASDAIDEPVAQDWRERARALLEDGSRERALALLAVAALELGLVLILAVSVTGKPPPPRVDAAERAPVRPAHPVHAPVERAPRKRRHAKRRKPARARPPLAVPKELHVLVLNGNGAPGAASRTAAIVGRLGYPVTTGDARSFDYRTSLLVYQPRFVREAARLARQLQIAVREPYDPSVWALGTSVDLAVIVGRHG